jgi:hypothetical protein
MDSKQEHEPEALSTEVADRGNQGLDEAYIEWTATENQRHKGVIWYMVLGVVVLGLIALAVLTKQWLSIGVFLAMTMAIVVYARRISHTQTCRLDSKGVTIDGRLYAYSSLRSFGVLISPDWRSIDFESTQRFMPRITMIYNSEDLDALVDYLATHLPRQDRYPDAVERMSHYLRF